MTPLAEFSDTICAISTPPGIGGIAVIRISGPDAIAIADSLWKGKPLHQAQSHTCHLGIITDPDTDSQLDQAVATIYRAPKSFTSDDVVELSVHGSSYIQRRIIEILTGAGCRLALPGEFTRRAYASGRIDLAEAEAVADIIAADSRAAHRIAISHLRGNLSKRLTELRTQLLELASLLELELDFSEEDVEFASRHRLRLIATQIHDGITHLHKSFHAGNAIKTGIPVAIVGNTNAGKSSLLNTLLDDDRAIVSNIHGTTRDTIEETITINDYTFRFIDTAGLRDTNDEIEKIGISRSLAAIAESRIIILLIDPNTSIDHPTIRRVLPTPEGRKLLIAINKTDITPESTISETLSSLASYASDPSTAILTISAKTRYGINHLTEILTEIARQTDVHTGDIIITNHRHAEALKSASDSISRVIEALDPATPYPAPPDLIAQDLRQTISHLSEITGDIPSAEILTTIFSRFCIGK